MRGGQQRLEWRCDSLAGALRTAKDGSSVQDIVVVDGPAIRSRKLSPREGARLMGLHDGYRLPDNTTVANTLLGDGVCVPVVRFLAAHVVEPILRIHG
jgi:DNA (cytosine-5)-methyltransferase 1